MIDVEVLIAPLISSSKSTVSRTAVPSAPLPLPPVITTSGAALYPLPGSLTAILTTLPLKIKADANACVPLVIVEVLQKQKELLYNQYR